jgi:hypothetical protein
MIPVDPYYGRTVNGQIICCRDGRCLLPDARWHGTAGGYSNHLCRCAACTEANSTAHHAGGAQDRYHARLRAQGLTSRGTPRQKPYTPQGSADLREVDTALRAVPKPEHREICGSCWLEIPASGRHECDR